MYTYILSGTFILYVFGNYKQSNLKVITT